MAKPLSAPSKKPRTSLGDPAKYQACAKGGITLHKRWGRNYRSQQSAKGGVILWLTRGSEYMAELGRKGGQQSVITRKKESLVTKGLQR